MTRILISAGEASGDLHAGALTRAILKIDPKAEVYGMGGEALKKAGGEVIFDIKDHSVMGFGAVIKKLPQLYKLREDFKKLMIERRPDCFVVIDYPDFNTRLSKIAKELKIPIVSFISPSAWVWRKGRAKSVAKTVNKVAAIFPFEYDVYKDAGADTEFVGHPLVDIVKRSISDEEATKKAGKGKDNSLVLLLPGSRLKEIEGMLPSMLEAVKIILKKKSNVDFVMPRAHTISKELLEEYIKKAKVKVKIIEGNVYDVMSVSDAALATSGTVTLEAALCNLPSVICYKTSAFAAGIVKLLIKIDCIGLPNIVAGHKIMPELLQGEMTPENMAKEVLRFLDPLEHAKVEEEIKEMKRRLGPSGAIERVARITLKLAGENV